MIVKANKTKKHCFHGVRFEVMAVSEKSMVTKMLYNVGDSVPMHQHPNEQTGYVVSGKYIMGIGTEKTELQSGDSFSIPGGEEHSLEVLEAGYTIDCFIPPRQDYL